MWIFIFLFLFSCSEDYQTYQQQVQPPISKISDAAVEDSLEITPNIQDSSVTSMVIDASHTNNIHDNINDPTPMTCQGCVDRAGNLNCDDEALNCIESFVLDPYQCLYDKKYCSLHNWSMYCTTLLLSDCRYSCILKCNSCAKLNSCVFKNYECDNNCNK
jgi:hypothetical protein